MVHHPEHRQNTGWPANSPDWGWFGHPFQCRHKCHMGHQCFTKFMGWLDRGGYKFFEASHRSRRNPTPARQILLHCLPCMCIMHQHHTLWHGLHFIIHKRPKQLSMGMSRPSKLHAIHMPRLYRRHSKRQAGGDLPGFRRWEW